MTLDYLKVKIYSLAEEAKYIRKLEQKRKSAAKWARDHVNFERRITWYRKEIERLINSDEEILDYAERIQFLGLEIRRLERQHNKKPVTVDDIQYNEKRMHGLQGHRVGVVRSESRAACLAYAFLRGYECRELEAKKYTEPKWDRVADLVIKYGEHGTAAERFTKLKQWMKDADVSNFNISVLENYVRGKYSYAVAKEKSPA